MADYIKREELENFAMDQIGGCVDLMQIHNFHAADVVEREAVCPHFIRNVHDRGDDSLCGKYRCEVERKKGKWRGWTWMKCVDYENKKYTMVRGYTCSECQRGTAVATKFCPNCGTEMESDE